MHQPKYWFLVVVFIINCTNFYYKVYFRGMKWKFVVILSTFDAKWPYLPGRVSLGLRVWVTQATPIQGVVTADSPSLLGQVPLKHQYSFHSGPFRTAAPLPTCRLFTTAVVHFLYFTNIIYSRSFKTLFSFLSLLLKYRPMNTVASVFIV